MVVTSGSVDAQCYGLALVKGSRWVNCLSEMEDPSVWCLPDVCHRESRFISVRQGKRARVAGLAAALRVEDCLGGGYGGVIWCRVLVEVSFVVR